MGISCFVTTPKLTAVWWRDRRDVFAMSTIHSASAGTFMKRPKGCKERRPTPCPTLISDYNQYRVDLTDQQHTQLLFTNYLPLCEMVEESLLANG